MHPYGSIFAPFWYCFTPFVIIICVQIFVDHVRPAFPPPFGVGAGLRAGPSPVGQVSKA